MHWKKYEDDVNISSELMKKTSCKYVVLSIFEVPLISDARKSFKRVQHGTENIDDIFGEL